MKKALALLLTLAMAFALVACGQSGGQTASGGDTANEAADAGDAGDANVEADANALKVGVFYYAFSDTYISTVRTALDAELNGKGTARAR